jgi:hypothetical protein
LILVFHIHSCSLSTSSRVKLVKALAFNKIFEYIGNLMYFISFMILSFLKVIFTASSLGSKVAKSYSFSTKISNKNSKEVIFISKIIFLSLLFSTVFFIIDFSYSVFQISSSSI